MRCAHRTRGYTCRWYSICWDEQYREHEHGPGLQWEDRTLFRSREVTWEEEYKYNLPDLTFNRADWEIDQNRIPKNTRILRVGTEMSVEPKEMVTREQIEILKEVPYLDLNRLNHLGKREPR